MLRSLNDNIFFSGNIFFLKFTFRVTNRLKFTLFFSLETLKTWHEYQRCCFRALCSQKWSSFLFPSILDSLKRKKKYIVASSSFQSFSSHFSHSLTQPPKKKLLLVNVYAFWREDVTVRISQEKNKGSSLGGVKMIIPTTYTCSWHSQNGSYFLKFSFDGFTEWIKL